MYRSIRAPGSSFSTSWKMAVHIIRPTINIRIILARCFDISVSRYAMSRCSLITRRTRRTRINWNTLDGRAVMEVSDGGQ